MPVVAGVECKLTEVFSFVPVSAGEWMLMPENAGGCRKELHIVTKLGTQRSKHWDANQSQRMPLHLRVTFTAPLYSSNQNSSIYKCITYLLGTQVYDLFV